MRKAARMRMGKTVTAVRAERSSPLVPEGPSGTSGSAGPGAGSGGVGSGESGTGEVMTQSYPAPPPRRQTFSQFDRVSARFAESGVGDSIRGGGAPRRPGAAAARFHRSAAGVRDGKWRSGRIVRPPPPATNLRKPRNHAETAGRNRHAEPNDPPGAPKPLPGSARTRRTRNLCAIKSISHFL